MSKYSGQFDFYDLIQLHGIDYILRSIIYVDNVRIEFISEQDCIPYYGYIMSCGGFNQNSATIYLVE